MSRTGRLRVGVGESTVGRLTRIGNPLDTAYTARVPSACDESAFTTGELLTADGGAGINGDLTMTA